MAPVFHAYTPNPSTFTFTMSTSTAAFTLLADQNRLVPLSVGRSSNVIELLVPPAPPIGAPVELKARCFDFLSDLLVSHSHHFSSAELIAAFSTHLPSSSFNAAAEAQMITGLVTSAVFSVSNFTGLGFRNSKGVAIQSVTTDPYTHSAGISYFVFQSIVDPAVMVLL
jgi:hypothetical protein